MLFATRKLKELELEIVTQAPTGTISITENGTVDVTDYASAEVNVDYATINFNLPAFTRVTPTGLSRGTMNFAATTVAPAGGSSPQSGYALFGGGGGSSSAYTTVNAYNTSLTRTTPTELSQGRHSLAATNVGGYALFGGGSNGSTSSSRVDAYDTSLTRTTPTELSQARINLAATAVGNYALFGGGSGSPRSSSVDAYDTSLTRTTPTGLSQGRENLAATNVGGYALFGGGQSSSFVYSSVVDAYDTSLTRTTPTELSQARAQLAATAVAPSGDQQSGYALFGGGYGSGSTYYATVDAYNTSLTRTTPTELSQGRDGLAATNVGGYALFAGGYAVEVEYRYDEDLDEYIEDYIYIYSNVVDAYNTSLTRTTLTELSQGRCYLAATTVGNYALFGGGYFYTDKVDAYSLTDYDIPLFPGTKYSFNGAAESTSSTWQTISIQGPAVGYTKIKNVTIN